MKNLYKIQDELYIVSDKEKSFYCIKECPMAGLNIDRCDCQIFTACSNKVGNIILTTNKSLINDGVQAIDDEFLQWFVKNPSCKRVRVDKFVSRKFFCTTPIISREETKPKTILESLQEYFKNTPKEKVLEDWNEFQHLDEEGITVKEFLENQKQETLEQAAEKYSENWEEITGLDYENTVPSEVNKLDFIAGAKWQMNKQDEFTLGFLHWYNTSQECETYLRRNYPKNITMNGERYKKVLQINKELLEMYKNTLPR